MGVTTIIKDYGTDILDAIRQNNLQKLQLILEKQLKSDSKIAKLCVTDIKHRPSKKFACPLILASRLEDPTILHYMISKGTNPNFVHHTIYSSKRREIVTPLHIAVDLGYYDTSEVLLSVNADCNIGDHNQETPLHIAVKKADRIMSRMLLSKGADPTIPDRNGNAALHTATLYGHLELVKTLLKYDADIFQKGNLNAIAPHIAAREGHVHLIQLFCGKHQANINIKVPCFSDGREKTPLHLSAEHGHCETTRALIEQYESELNIKDSDGNTPLHCCVLNPHDPHRLREKESFNETARILIKHRVSINSKNVFGDTALHLAAMNHFQRIVEMLLEVGANPFLENNEKLKPIDVVPEDDPVTQQVLKMAMAQGPRPLKYPSPNSTFDKSSGTLSSGQTGSSRGGQKDHISLATTGVGPIETSSALDRSLSIHSSASTLPSVFVDEAAETKRHKHLAAGPDKGGKGTKTSSSGQTQTAKTVTSAQQTTDKEIQQMNARTARGHGGGRHTGRLSSGDSSYMDDTYSFMSESTMQDGSTQTKERRVRDAGVMAKRDRTKSYNKRLQTSFDLDKSISMSDMTSQTDLSILDKGHRGKHGWYDHDPYESSRLKDKHREPSSESSRHKDKRHHDPYTESSRQKDKHQRQSKEAGLEASSKSRKGHRHASSDSLTTQDSRGHRGHHKSKGRHKSSVTEEETESESVTDDEEEEEGKSQVSPYKSKKAGAGGDGVAAVGKLPPGSVRVNTLPGKPGTIELQYSGGPLTIALDTQAFNTFQPDQQGDYFYDQQGHQYPASLIHALQQAAGMMKGNQANTGLRTGNQTTTGLRTGNQPATPLVTTQTGDQVHSIYHSPLPSKQKAKQPTGTGKPRMPTPPTDDEVIYANEEEIQSMIDSSVNSEATPSRGLKSPHAFVKTAISQRVHEVTKTPKSPTSFSDRSTPTRAAKQQDHLRKILGRATPTKRGNTPTNVVPAGRKVFEFEEIVSSAPSESVPSEIEPFEDEEENEEEDELAEEEEAPVLPASEPPTRKPPQKQPRRSLQTPKTTEEEELATGEKVVERHEEVSHIVETTKTVKTNRKYPQTPLVITRADGSFEENEYDSGADQWDETPNASPEHKSFSQKLAWAKALEEGITPKTNVHKEESEDDDMSEEDEDEDDLAGQQIVQVAYSSSRPRKSRPPLSPGYRKTVGGVIREESEEEEEGGLPEYTKIQEVSSSSEEDSDEESSEEDSDTDSDEEGESDGDNKGKQQAAGNKLHSSEPSSTMKEASSSSEKRSRTSETTVVKTVRELQTSVQTERVEVVSSDLKYGEEGNRQQLDRLKAEAIEKQERLEGAGLRLIPGRPGGALSPSGEYDPNLLGSGRQTPDSVYSEGGSSYSGRGGLNMRVTGDTPKAYTHAEKEHKRIEWIKARPVGIESGSEYSDNEFGSVSSLNRSLSPGGSERARKWSEGNKPLYRKQTPTGTVYGVRLEEPSDQTRVTPATSEDESRAKMIGSYAKPYKSFGKIETQTDLLEEAMMGSPMSPMSPIHTLQEIKDLEDDEQEEYAGTIQQEPGKHKMGQKEDKFQLRVSPAQFLETDPEKAHSMDSDEGPNLDSASATVARSPFKKNIKMALPGPDMYETEVIEQPVSIGASEEDLLRAAEINMTKHKRHTHEKSEKTIVTKTVSSTVVSTVTSTAQQAQDTEYYIVSTDSSNSEEETSSGSEESESESEDITQYNEEPKRRLQDKDQDISDILADNGEGTASSVANNDEGTATSVTNKSASPEGNNKQRIPSLAEIDDEFNEFRDVETVEMNENRDSENTKIMHVKSTPFDQFTQSPVVTTKKVKKTKKKAKKVKVKDADEIVNDPPVIDMEIEEYGAEPGMKRSNRLGKSKAADTEADKYNEELPNNGVLAEASVNSVEVNNESIRDIESKEMDKSERKKVKKVKKKVKVTESHVVIEDNVQNLNMSVPESEGFPYSREISLQEVDTEREYITVPPQNTNETSSVLGSAGAANGDEVTSDLLENVKSAYIHTDDGEPTQGQMEMADDQSEQIMALPDNIEPGQTKGKVFETSFGPEDEEVAQINIAAAERKKKKKEKRKKIKKQEEEWADEQKQWDEKKQGENSQKVMESNIEDIKQQGNQAVPGDGKLATDLANAKPPVPAAEITFSGGIEVIDETHKKKKKKKKSSEDPEKTEKNKSKKKDEKGKKKKSSKSKPEAESIDMEANLTDPTKTSDIFPVTEVIAENVMLTTETIPDVHKDVNSDLRTEEKEGFTMETYREDGSPFSSEVHHVDMESNENEKNINHQPDRNSKPHKRKHDKDLYNTGVITEFGENQAEIIPDEEEAIDTEDEETSRYAEIVTTSTDQEKRMWEIYQRQRDGTQAKHQAGKSSKSHDIKETDIDADIVETNIDDDLEKYYHEIDEVNMDPSNPNMNKSKLPERNLTGSKQPRTGKEDADESEEEESFEDDDDDQEAAEIHARKSRRQKREQKPRKHGSVALQKGGELGLQVAGRHDAGDEEEQPPHSWSDQKEQEEKMRRLLQNYKEYDGDAVSLDSEQYTAEYDIQAPHHTGTGREGQQDESAKKRHGQPYHADRQQHKPHRQDRDQPGRDQGQPYDLGRDQGQPYHPDRDQGQPYHPDRDQGQPYHPDRDQGQPYHPDRDQGQPYHPGRDQGQPYHPGRDQGQPYHRDRDQGQPHHPGRDQPQAYHPQRDQPRHPQGVRTLPNMRSAGDRDLMAEMWGDQNRPYRQGQPERHASDRHRRTDTTSDNESSSARRRRQKKKARFLEDAHSDADISALDPLTTQAGKTLQEAAMETLTASLQNQPKLQPRKPIEAAMERPINYTRGVYRPQPVYWRGSRGNQSTSLSSRYDDSQLLPQMWSDDQRPEFGTESEGEPDVEYLQPVSSRGTRPAETGSGYPQEGEPEPMDQMGGAFQPFSAYEGGSRKHVQIYDAEAERRRREEREAHRARKRRKEKAPKTDIGPVDFTKYPATAKLWMEQVDKETVQKSKTMYLSVMPEGMKPPPELENSVPQDIKPGERGDVYLPPQWVIARGRSLRRKKQRLDSQRMAAESFGSLSASGITSGESDFEGADRPMSPGRQILLFFRVSSTWTDLAWVLFEGIQTDSETKRMLADIQIKHPRDLTKQVHSCMHRWWKTKGPDATIEELRQALDIVGMPYIQEQYFQNQNRKSNLTSYTDTEDDLDISQISDNDPEVSRLINQYQARSLNASFDIPGETLSPAGKMNMSKDSLLRRLEDKGTKIDRSRLVSNLSANSRDSVFKRNSEMSLPTDRHGASQEYYDDYLSDGESRRAFVIVQPQLKHKDYNYESQI